MIIDATDKNFEELTKDGLCMIMFHMEHCHGCESLMPALMRIETQLPFVKFVRVNIDECPETKEKFKAYATPTVYFSNEGKLDKYPGMFGIKNVRNALGRTIYGKEGEA